MKLHRLEITAFGPFAGHEVVEFDTLNEAGVFLLNGETGAGKTSVLDAICFALYSSAPTTVAMGGRKPGHSDHADPDTAPLVDLEFSAGGRRWHISRSPAWSKPSKRAASGWSEQHAKVLLREFVAGVWEERGYRPDDVAQTVEHVVGLNREQFTQVMMLPQGRFAQFLRAGSKEREKLLETLFGTDIYPRIQQELKDLASAAQADLDALRLDQQRDLERVSQLDEQLAEVLAQLPAETVPLSESPGSHTGDDPVAHPTADAAGEMPAQTTLEELSGKLATVVPLLTSARNAVSAQQTQAAARARELTEWLSNIERHDRLSGLRAELEAQRDTVRIREAQLTRHRAARQLAGLANAADHAESAVDHARTTARAAREALSAGSTGHERFRLVLGGHGAVLEGWLTGDRDLAAVRDAAVGARHGAQQALEEEESLHTSQLALTDVEQHLAQHHARKETVENILGRDIEERAAVERTGDELREATRDAAVIRDRDERVRQTLAATETFQELARERDARGDHYRTAEDARRAAAHRVEELEAQRFASAAATLASALRASEPCPVCGSTLHPAPAGHERGREVTERTLAGARATRDEAQAESDRTHGEWQAAQQRAAQALGAGAEEDITAVRAAAAESAQAVARLERQLVRARETADTLTTLEHRIDESRAALRDIDLRIERDATRRTSLTAQLQEARERLDRELAGFASARQRMAAAQDLMEAVSVMETAQRGLDRATQELDYARHTLTGELAESPFATAEEVRSALLEPSEAQEIETWLQHHHDRLGKITAELATETMVATGQLSPRERAETSTESVARAAQHSESLAAQRDRITAASGTVTALERAVRELDRAVGDRGERLRRAREKSERLTGLSAVANGLSSDNSLRMTLTSFVLAAKLEHVAAVASEHLQRMSSGRFSLLHTDQTRGGGKAGLGLEVDDSWTGVRRGTETLSGGESFFTSLALALALADVVRAAAGGQEMDTLFVDEGFGSLDEDTLEQVLQTIDGLRQNGRVIGLVSHVAEMKQRIGAQLVVTKTPRGSHLRVMTGLETNA
ncbi:SMC family ATPase [Kocuria sp. cx-455]|uniref:AAA family ATPase n=1 Tax=Kocuria sp. cx-455 TaxID=2771377 RepID=UPI001682D772|nr:SMC family ATPase [Kocuria sp. cx-455]MBD2764723.1 SMC family ATPase [Kocuria sp. cx-455]